MSACCNNGFKMIHEVMGFKMWLGLVGPPGPQGPPGTGVELRGPVASVADLPATAPSGELWQVGTQAPYNGYFFNGTSWVNLGPVAAGATFTPTVSSDGVISWTNDGSLPNPESVNIKGPQGATGATFTPSVSISGVISWTNDGGLPNPESVDIRGPQGPQGRGVAVGGSAGQVLKKHSATNYDTEWAPDPNANIGIVQNGNTATQNITKGQYVIWKGALYIASAAIAYGDTLSDSNLTAVTGGGLNNLDGKLSALQNAAVTTVVVRWDTDLSAQTVNLNNGLYLVAVDSRNSATDEATGLYIVESNYSYNSHVTTVRQPTTPKALISAAEGVLTVSPQSAYGFAAIAKLITL